MLTGTKLLVSAPALRVYKVLVESDMIALRFLIAEASILWWVLLAFGGNYEIPVFDLLRQFYGPTAVGGLFLGHGLSSFIALFSKHHIRYFNLFSDMLGSVLWTGCAVFLMLSEHPMPAHLSAEVSLALGSWWCLVRRMYDE